MSEMIKVEQCLFTREEAEKVARALGWTPPPKKPAHPKEPIRLWANVYETYIGSSETKEHASKFASPGLMRSAVPLIEAGWCQMVPHDGSAECPCDENSPVTVLFKTGNYESFNEGHQVKWKLVVCYAAILPVEEGHVY